MRIQFPLHAGVTLIALASACHRASPDAAKPEAGDKIKVSVAEVTEGTMPRVLPLSGSLRGEKQSDLAAGTAGRLVKVNIERGSDVKAGAVLAVVDTRQAQVSAAELTTSAALAREQGASAIRDCERNKSLLDKGSISQAEYDRFSDQCRNAALSVRAAELRAQQAGIHVSDGVIRAPFSGTVAERFVDVGEYVRVDSKVVSLVTLDPLRLEFSVPEARMALVKPNGVVHFTVPAHPGKTFTGAIRYIASALRESTRDLGVEAVVDNADRLLAPGMFAEISLILGDDPVPSVPASSLVTTDGAVHAFVVEGGRAIERVVVIGAAQGTIVPVPRGLKLGEKVIVSPPKALVNGAYVEL